MYAIPANNMEYPRRFRPYRVRALASANCQCWEAARALRAAPTFFKRIKIDDGGRGKENFVDGGLRCNDLTKQVLEDAKALVTVDWWGVLSVSEWVILEPLDLPELELLQVVQPPWVLSVRPRDDCLVGGSPTSIQSEIRPEVFL